MDSLFIVYERKYGLKDIQVAFLMITLQLVYSESCVIN